MDNLKVLQADLRRKSKQVAVYANGLAELRRFVKAGKLDNESGVSVVSREEVLRQLAVIERAAYEALCE